MKIETKEFDQAVAKGDLRERNRRIANEKRALVDKAAARYSRNAAIRKAEQKMTEALEILRALEPTEHMDDIKHFRFELQQILECDCDEYGHPGAGLRKYIKDFCG